VDTIDRTVENMNIVCIKHSKYDGRDAPVLSYKTCVAKFVAELQHEKSDEKPINQRVARIKKERNQAEER